MPEPRLNSKYNLARRADRSYAVMAFLLPFLILSIGYATRGIFPFGDKHLLTVDLFHQYAPFLSELRSKILSGDSLFYSFTGGLGVNFYALLAYYLASPLNLILLLFPASFLTEGVLFLTLIKLSLAGFTFNIFLRKTFQKHGPLAVGFSTVYAISSYVIAYSWNIMWLDSLYVAPLVMLGLVSLIRDKKFWLYTLSLGYLMFVNFYMAWFVCLMVLILYFPFLLRFSPENKPVIKLVTTIKTLFFTGLGIGLSAFLLWPTYLALQVTSAANDSFPTGIEKVATLFDYFGQHLMLVEPTVRSGFPNLYAGIFVLLLLPVALLNTKVKLRDRITSFTVIAFMVLSFSTNFLNFVWHGFHYPNQLPYRNSFIYIFILLTFTYEALPGIRQLSRETIFSFAFTVIALIIMVEKVGENVTSDFSTLFSVLFILVYATVFIRLLNINKHQRPVTLLLLSIMIIEIAFSTSIGLYYLDKNEYFGSREGYAYGPQADSIRAAVAQVDEFAEDSLFYRSEVYPAKTSNDTFLYGLRGLTLFASTSPEKPVKLFKDIGCFSNGINSYKYDGSNIVLDSLFGIRYLILRNHDYWRENTRHLVLSNEEVHALENPYALNLGYKVSSDLLHYDSEGENPLENQNRLLKSMDPNFTDVFIPVPLEAGISSQATFYPYDDTDTVFSFEKDAEDSEATLNFTLLAEQNGTYNLAFDMRGHQTSSGKISVDEKSFDFSSRGIGIAEVGYLEAGQIANIKINLSSKSEGSGEFELYAARLDREAFTTSVDSLRETQLELDYFSSSYFRGKIDMPEAGLLLLTVPNDRGWTARVDGKVQEIETVQDSLMALSLEPGEHKIEMRFLPYGFDEGLLVTLVSIAVLLIIALIQLIRMVIRKRKAASEDSPTDKSVAVPAKLRDQDKKINSDDKILPDKESSMKEIKFFFCSACGNIVVMLSEGIGEMICCDEPMELLQAEARSDDNNAIKAIERTDRGLKITLDTDSTDGERQCSLEWIVIVQANRYQIHFLEADDSEIEFTCQDKPVDVYTYCIMHGLQRTHLD